MGDVISVASSTFAAAFFLVMSACAALEPDQSVWIMAGFGSGCAAFYRGRLPVYVGLGQWITGMVFGVCFVVLIDHLQSEAEAFLVGLSSGTAIRVFISQSGNWVGGAMSGMTGGSRRGL
jgi:hypothetical protein